MTSIKWLPLVFYFSFLSPLALAVPDARPTLTMFDMSQGEGMLIHCPNSSEFIMVDFGASSEGDVVGEEAAVYTMDLLSRNVQNNLTAPMQPIKLLVITHADSDHYNQVSRLLAKGIRISTVYLGGKSSQYNSGNARKLRDALTDAQNVPPTSTVKQVGDIIYAATDVDASGVVDSHRLLGLANCATAPGADDPRIEFNVLSNDTRSSVKNENSVVLQMDYFRGPTLFSSIYLTGDALEKTEKAILHESPMVMTMTAPQRILKLAHHGSHLSNSTDFLTAIQPTHMMVSGAGPMRNRRWNHPACEIKARSVPTGTATMHANYCLNGEWPNKGDKTEVEDTTPFYSTTTLLNVTASDKARAGTDIQLFYRPGSGSPYLDFVLSDPAPAPLP